MVKDNHSGQTTDRVNNRYIKRKDGWHTPHTASQHPKDPPQVLNNMAWTHSLTVVTRREEKKEGWWIVK